MEQLLLNMQPTSTVLYDDTMCEQFLAEIHDIMMSLA